ncbi:hypothetical protein VN97_g10319 [Penicillium thymicola]|uniref:Uncharacterized protein n=1 Tax=Penicillium thymicola TaxID=293382 RepID=A0AAI9TAB8_PENTH|nr:hypothetical protein VN97_g10319 [Penicillium thymicola]
MRSGQDWLRSFPTRAEKSSLPSTMVTTLDFQYSHSLFLRTFNLSHITSMYFDVALSMGLSYIRHIALSSIP